MFPKMQAMAQDPAIISQEHRTGSEGNPLSPTLASLEWKEQDSMPMSQQQRQQLATSGPEGPSSGPGQTATVRLSSSKPTPERQPRPKRRAPANRKRERQSAPKPTPAMARPLLSARPALPCCRAETTGRDWDPFRSSPLPAGSPRLSRQAWLRARRAIPLPELLSPPPPPPPPRPRTHRPRCSVLGERKSGTTPWQRAGYNGARMTRTCGLTG